MIIFTLTVLTVAFPAGSTAVTVIVLSPFASPATRQLQVLPAIVTGPDGLRYVIAIYARQVEDTRWTIENDALTTGARISKLVYEYFDGR